MPPDRSLLCPSPLPLLQRWAEPSQHVPATGPEQEDGQHRSFFGGKHIFFSNLVNIKYQKTMVIQNGDLN